MAPGVSRHCLIAPGHDEDCRVRERSAPPAPWPFLVVSSPSCRCAALRRSTVVTYALCSRRAASRRRTAKVHGCSVVTRVRSFTACGQGLCEDSRSHAVYLRSPDKVLSLHTGVR